MVPKNENFFYFFYFFSDFPILLFFVIQFRLHYAFYVRITNHFIIRGVMFRKCPDSAIFQVKIAIYSVFIPLGPNDKKCLFAYDSHKKSPALPCPLPSWNTSDISFS